MFYHTILIRNIWLNCDLARIQEIRGSRVSFDLFVANLANNNSFGVSGLHLQKTQEQEIAPTFPSTKVEGNLICFCDTLIIMNYEIALFRKHA